MRSIIAALVLLGLSGTSAAQTGAQPKLIVAISIDQFSARLFDEYRPDFTGGLARLAGGVSFSNGYQAHGATETCPGHSTILTGAHPTRTGIIANLWFDPAAPRADKMVYCAEDERVAGSNSKSYTVSDAHLRVPTLGDLMKQANPASRVVAVSGKDRAAVMMGGHHPDQRWWWSSGRFVQNSAATPAPIAAQVNASIAQAIAQARDPLVPPDFCASRDRAIPIGAGKSVGTFRFQRAAGDAAAFGTGPEVDAATLAMAAALTQQMQLGRGAAPDLLAISLSATDFVGHRYGPEGLEECLQLTSLDADLGGFFEVLDQMGVDYAVVLTADHGGLDLPERQRLLGDKSAARLDEAATPEAIGADVAQRLGFTAPVFVGEWYLSGSVPAARKDDVLALAARLLRAHPQVDSVFTSAEVQAHPMPTARPESWSVLDRLRASWDPARSPALAVVDKQGVTPIPNPTSGYVATHGSVWDYDRKVPILFWWKGISGEARPESAMTVDIMPTLASLIHLPLSGTTIDGHCIDLIAGAATNCP